MIMCNFRENKITLLTLVNIKEQRLIHLCNTCCFVFKVSFSGRGKGGKTAWSREGGIEAEGRAPRGSSLRSSDQVKREWCENSVL